MRANQAKIVRRDGTAVGVGVEIAVAGRKVEWRMLRKWRITCHFMYLK